MRRTTAARSRGRRLAPHPVVEAAPRRADRLLDLRRRRGLHLGDRRLGRRVLDRERRTVTRHVLAVDERPTRLDECDHGSPSSGSIRTLSPLGTVLLDRLEAAFLPLRRSCISYASEPMHSRGGSDASTTGCRFALGALVLLGAALRLERLGSTPLNFDESFTAMVGRLPLGNLFGFLRAARLAPSARLPAPAPTRARWARARSCSGSRRRCARSRRSRCSPGGCAIAAGSGSSATVSDGDLRVPDRVRDAKPACTGRWSSSASAPPCVADSWLRAPAPDPRGRSSARSTFVGLMTHVSMALVAVGLLVLAGRRRDARRLALARRASPRASAGGRCVWGPSFLVQSRGGHSSWIPHTTPARFVDTISSLVTSRPGVSVLVVAAIVAGGIVCRAPRPERSRWSWCAAPRSRRCSPGCSACGRRCSSNRTLTVAAWGPLLALGYLVDAVVPASARTPASVAAVGRRDSSCSSSVPAALNRARANRRAHASSSGSRVRAT